MGDDEPRVEARGAAFLEIAEGGRTTEVNSPIGITVDRATRWRGRPDREPVVSESPEVRRFMRKAVYTMRPDPIPRPIRPVPKPAPSRQKAKADIAPAEVRCPRCGGDGTVETDAGVPIECDLCEGDGRVPARLATIWLEEHD